MAQTKAALDLQQRDPAAAGQAWAKVDRMFVDAAPMAALVNQRESDFVSARVGNYQHHPEWGGPLRPALGQIGERRSAVRALELRRLGTDEAATKRHLSALGRLDESSGSGRP